MFIISIDRLLERWQYACGYGKAPFCSDRVSLKRISAPECSRQPHVIPALAFPAWSFRDSDAYRQCLRVRFHGDMLKWVKRSQLLVIRAVVCASCAKGCVSECVLIVLYLWVHLSVSMNQLGTAFVFSYVTPPRAAMRRCTLL